MGRDEQVAPRKIVQMQSKMGFFEVFEVRRPVRWRVRYSLGEKNQVISFSLFSTQCFNFPHLQKPDSISKPPFPALSSSVL